LNAVEIEEAITNLAEQDFDSEGFPYAFLEAFGNKATTITEKYNRLTSAFAYRKILNSVALSCLPCSDQAQYRWLFCHNAHLPLLQS
jgi:hypothetical protein